MIDSPPRKRDPLTIAAKMARMSNDIGLDAEESAIMKDAAILLRQLHNACHKAGLTVEQLEGDAIGELVTGTTNLIQLLKGTDKQIGVMDTVDSYYDWYKVVDPLIARLESALRPFTPEAK